MKKRKIVYSVASLLLAFAWLAPVQVAHAAQQTVTIPTQAASDDPAMVENGIVIGSISELGVNLQPPLSDTTTPLDDASLLTPAPNGYTWRLIVPELCSGAQFTGLKITTSTVATDEEPVSGVLLGLYGSNNLALFDSYTIHNGNGEDGTTWVQSLFGAAVPIVDRGAAGSWMSVPTFPADLGMAGTLDVTWDISGLTPGQPVGIYIQHWLSGDVTTAQTTIQSATLSYDDSGCVETSSPIVANNNTATLASTGTNGSEYFTISLVLVATAFVLKRRVSISNK